MKKFKTNILFPALMLLMLLASNGHADTVNINFRDAEIRAVIESLASITGKSFVIDPRVKGKITIIAPEPIEEDMLYEAVLSALQVQGFQAVFDGSITRVVPYSQGFQIPKESSSSGRLATKVLKINNVKASELVAVLKPVMSKGALLQAYDSVNLLIMTDLQKQISLIEDLLKQIDVKDESEVEVIDFEHISAGEALHIANGMKLFQKMNLSIVEDSYNNRVIVGGSKRGRQTVKTLFRKLDTPSSAQAGVEVVYLSYSKAEEIKPILESLLSSETFLKAVGETTSASGRSNSSSKYKIEAEKDNNALLIAASDKVIGQLKSIIRKLDRPRSQVLIEAVIAEVSEGQAKRLSAQLAGYSRLTGGVLTKFDDVLTTILGGAIDQKVDASDLVSISGSLKTQGTYLAAGDYDEKSGRGFGALIDALKTDSQTVILSSPSLMTLDNEEAELTSGKEVPFITGSYTQSNNSSSNPFQTIQRQEIGVKLKVIPQINEGNAVRLEIEQESSSISDGVTTDSASDIITNKSRVKTNVMVGNGEMLILGGLTEDTKRQSVSKVPILGDIPLLGKLFSSSSKNKSNKVLMLFIRPTILRSPAESNQLTADRFKYLKTYQVEGLEGSKKTDTSALRPFLEEGLQLLQPESETVTLEGATE